MLAMYICLIWVVTPLYIVRRKPKNGLFTECLMFARCDLRAPYVQVIDARCSAKHTMYDAGDGTSYKHDSDMKRFAPAGVLFSNVLNAHLILR
jgi:hypothetical protein